MDSTLPGSSVHGISQAGILEWVAISFCRGSSQSRDRTCVSCISRRVVYTSVTWEAQMNEYVLYANKILFTKRSGQEDTKTRLRLEENICKNIS